MVPLRVWLLTNAPSPYQSELFSAIADRADIELEVRFLEAGSPAGRSSSCRYAHRVMRSVLPRFVRSELQFHPRAVWECAVGPQDCYVLSGLYTSMTFLACALVLTIRSVPWVVWFERPRPQSREQASWSPRWLMSRPVRSLRMLVRQWVLRSAHRVICIGTQAREAYAAEDVPSTLLDVLPYCCEIDRYAAIDAAAIDSVKSQFNLHGRTVFLFSGQMIERKGVDVAIAAFERAAADRPAAAMLLLGNGPLRTSLQADVPQSIRDRVHFAGHVLQDDLPALFRAADAFVFPSRHDGWGVVINEACAAGLPIITTHQTGAARDLVEHGRSGFVLERDDVEGFATAVRHLIDHPEERAAFGRRSRELVEQFSPDRGAERFQQAVAAACRE
ncbi:MAG: glycosyltransferase family 4 protein [Planctomycetaceae bacterium]|nr:glycosyltransferase family 4 protein [Planctomycetaceae bacterium]